MMRLPKKDFIATCAVAAAIVFYVLWLADAAVLGMSSIRVTGLTVLALGFAASAIAVVPGFDQLMHGNRLYLATTSVLGVAALAAGVIMLAAASSAALAWLMVAMVTLWAIATIHHAVLAKAAQGGPHGERADTDTALAGRRIGTV
jgi:hypothetical protein